MSYVQPLFRNLNVVMITIKMRTERQTSARMRRMCMKHRIMNRINDITRYSVVGLNRQLVYCFGYIVVYLVLLAFLKIFSSQTMKINLYVICIFWRKTIISPLRDGDTKNVLQRKIVEQCRQS